MVVFIPPLVLEGLYKVLLSTKKKKIASYTARLFALENSDEVKGLVSTLSDLSTLHEVSSKDISTLQKDVCFLMKSFSI